MSTYTKEENTEAVKFADHCIACNLSHAEYYSHVCKKGYRHLTEDQYNDRVRVFADKLEAWCKECEEEDAMEDASHALITNTCEEGYSSVYTDEKGNPY